MSRIRRFIRRLFLFISMVTGSIATAIDNYEFTIEKETRTKRIAEIGEMPEDAVEATRGASSRNGVWDDRAQYAPPGMM